MCSIQTMSHPPVRNPSLNPSRTTSMPLLKGFSRQTKESLWFGPTKKIRMPNKSSKSCAKTLSDRPGHLSTHPGSCPTSHLSGLAMVSGMGLPMDSSCTGRSKSCCMSHWWTRQPTSTMAKSYICSRMRCTPCKTFGKSRIKPTSCRLAMAIQCLMRCIASCYSHLDLTMTPSMHQKGGPSKPAQEPSSKRSTHMTSRKMTKILLILACITWTAVPPVCRPMFMIRLQL